MEVMCLKILNKEFHPLKSGHTFVMLSVQGKRGEEINIATEGVSGKVIFYSEAPKTDLDCVYCADENTIELGGAEVETKRTLYLVVEPNVA